MTHDHGFPRTACLLLAIAFCVATSDIAFALSGELESAGSLMLSVDTPRDRVRAALEQPSCKFIGGSFVNAQSSLRFAGDATTAITMANELAEIPGITVSISFIRADDASDWHVLHDVRNSTFRVVLNLNSARIDLNELVIPYSVGAPAFTPATE